MQIIIVAALLSAFVAADATSFVGEGNLIIYNYGTADAVGCGTDHGLWTDLGQNCATYNFNVTETGGSISTKAGYCGYGVTSLGYGFSCGLKQTQGVYEFEASSIP